jgi:hypothetical protein
MPSPLILPYKIYKMKKTYLFAIDLKTEETIVSASEKGSNQVNFIERIRRSDNELLFDSVAILTKIASAPNLDIVLFKAMDKVCQLVYNKHIEN